MGETHVGNSPPDMAASADRLSHQLASGRNVMRPWWNDSPDSRHSLPKRPQSLQSARLPKRRGRQESRMACALDASLLSERNSETTINKRLTPKAIVKRQARSCQCDFDNAGQRNCTHRVARVLEENLVTRPQFKFSVRPAIHSLVISTNDEQSAVARNSDD